MKMQSSFRDMVIQSFLKWGEFWGYLPIFFKGLGILFKIFKGIWDTWDPPTGPHNYYLATSLLRISDDSD